MKFGTAVRGLAGVVAVSMLASGCAGEVGPTSAVTAPAPFGLNAAQLSLVTEKTAVAGDIPGARWAAVLHADAMQDVMANGAALRSAGPAERCASVAKIVRKLFPAVKARSMLSDASLESLLAETLKRGGCGVSAPASIFGTRMIATAAAQSAELMPYAQDIENSYLVASSPADVEASATAALASATSLPAAEYEVLSALASMAVSDAYYWYSVEQSGGCGACGGGGGDDPPPVMSVFGSLAAPNSLPAMSVFGSLAAQNCRFWCRAGWSDLVGGIAGAAATFSYSGGAVTVVPQVAVAGAIIGGVGASALYAIGAM